MAALCCYMFMVSRLRDIVNRPLVALQHTSDVYNEKHGRAVWGRPHEEIKMYQVKWVSPRGFANEGTYLYGKVGTFLEDEYFALVKESANRGECGKIVTLSQHKTLEAARTAAKKIERTDRRSRIGWGEVLHTGTRQVGQDFDD